MDISIWEHAKAGAYAIVTADADAYELASTFGPPPESIEHVNTGADIGSAYSPELS